MIDDKEKNPSTGNSDEAAKAAEALKAAELAKSVGTGKSTTGSKPKQQVNSDEFFKEKAEEARVSGEDVPIDLTTKIKVEFLQDVGFMTKGMKQEISQSAFDTYNMSDEKLIKEIR